jgi:hypothetical protein
MWLSGNRPFGGRSAICPETVFDDGKPDGMIVGRENGRARTSPEGSLRIAKETKGLNSWFVPLTVQKVTDLELTPMSPSRKIVTAFVVFCLVTALNSHPLRLNY